jgi:hypothetical protein
MGCKKILQRPKGVFTSSYLLYAPMIFSLSMRRIDVVIMPDPCPMGRN